MCGNFYGSREVINADSRRGEKILEEYKLVFNVTTSRELNEICSKDQFCRALNETLMQWFNLVLDKSELTDGCYCMRVNLVVCYNFTALPVSFPRDVRKCVTTCETFVASWHRLSAPSGFVNWIAEQLGDIEAWRYIWELWKPDISVRKPFLLEMFVNRGGHWAAA